MMTVSKAFLPLLVWACYMPSAVALPNIVHIIVDDLGWNNVGWVS